MTYSLRLLGGISLDGPSGPLTGPVVQPRQSALLAILGVARDNGASREKVVGLLWPESDQAEARHTLSNSVYELRRALGENAVLVSGDNLRLNSEVTETDVAAFGKALARGDLIGAVEAYGGPFLDGFYLSGAEEFERWVEAERQRLAVQYGEALESLAESAEEAGDFPRAVGWWQRLAAYDPYNSRFAVRLMQAMAAAGDPANALQYAQEHERFLQNELGIDPPEDVLALAERLRRERVSSKPTFEAEPVGVKTTPEGAKRAAEPTAIASPANRRSRMVLIAVAAAIAIGAAALVFLPEWGVTLDKNRVLVAVFENRTGDPSLDPLGVMAADWITEGLSRTGVVEVSGMGPGRYSGDRLGFLDSKSDEVAPIRILPILIEGRVRDPLIAWLPDDERLLFKTALDGEEMLLFAPSSGGPMGQFQLPEDAWWVGPVAAIWKPTFMGVFSADGRYMLYAAGDPRAEERPSVLKVLSLEDGSAWELSSSFHLTEVAGRGGAPFRDGAEFVYVELRDSVYELRASSPEGPSRLVWSFGRDAPGEVGVHGDRILFAEYLEEVETRIYTATVEENEPRELIRLAGWAGPSLWSPDGRRIATTHYIDDGNGTGIFDSRIVFLEVSPSGDLVGEPRYVGEPMTSYWNNVWLPDSRGILTTGMDGNVWLMSAEASQDPVALTRDDPNESWNFVLSPDGRHVAYSSRMVRGSSLWLVDLSGALEVSGN